jgi:hypothetical protein
MIDESDFYTAIYGRWLLRFAYRGHECVVEPYAYGTDDGGHPILRAYQIGGTGDPRKRGWKLFRVDRIKGLQVLDATFGELHPGFMRNEPTMRRIYCEIQPPVI